MLIDDGLTVVPRPCVHGSFVRTNSSTKLSKTMQRLQNLLTQPREQQNADALHQLDDPQSQPVTGDPQARSEAPHLGAKAKVTAAPKCKAKAKVKASPKSKCKAKAKAKASPKPKCKAQPKTQASEPVWKRPSSKKVASPASTKQTTVKRKAALKKTPECVYSRAYHKTVSILVRFFEYVLYDITVSS